MHLTMGVVKISRNSRDQQAMEKTAVSSQSRLRLSVVVCIRNGQHDLLNLLEALERQKFEGDWEVIMVDDD